MMWVFFGMAGSSFRKLQYTIIFKFLCGQPLAISDGIYRNPEGVRLLDYGYFAIFSPDSQYVATDAVYRLDDQERLFDISLVPIKVSEDSRFIFTDNSIYRIPDGRHYAGLRILDTSSGVLAIGETILIVDSARESQDLIIARVSADNTPFYLRPQKENNYLNIQSDTYLIVTDIIDGWYRVIYDGQQGWLFSNDVEIALFPQ
jgi:hypothetical protein